MRETVPQVALHHLEVSDLLWCLGAVMVGCLSWFFYILYAVLR